MPKPEQLTLVAQTEVGRIEKPAIIEFVTLKEREFITPWHKKITHKKGVTGFIVSADKFVRIPDGVEIRIAAIKVTDKDILEGMLWAEQKLDRINLYKDTKGKKLNKLVIRQMQLSSLMDYGNSK